MYDRKVTVLLIECDIHDARTINQILSAESGIHFVVDLVENLSAGLEYLRTKPYDIVLLNLSLPENQGLDTLELFHGMVPNIPIIIMTREYDENMGLRLIQNGAQDYLVKDPIDRSQLVKAILFAIERSRLQIELMSRANTDELTGLYNRRGFLSLAEQQKKIALRTNKELLLFFIDVDGLKHINGSFGHREGDAALVETAKILKNTFRESDIVSRVGGDEYAVLAVETNENFSDMILNRINENISKFNSNPGILFELSLSIGVTKIHPRSSETMEELLNKADSMMYEHKSNKKLK